ncbi:hypothetical protein JEQ12_015060 [Ovis aries]|uniref:Uncharacterized protein n=1 Tax=Ovis aries TaxID=9940 RepID=A0A836D4G4_SHEEP|nr:hypothetical protein JEQ12_015060 [Ovis aries]
MRAKPRSERTVGRKRKAYDKPQRGMQGDRNPHPRTLRIVIDAFIHPEQIVQRTPTLCQQGILSGDFVAVQSPPRQRLPAAGAYSCFQFTELHQHERDHAPSIPTQTPYTPLHPIGS